MYLRIAYCPYNPYFLNKTIMLGKYVHQICAIKNMGLKKAETAEKQWLQKLQMYLPCQKDIFRNFNLLYTRLLLTIKDVVTEALRKVSQLVVAQEWSQTLMAIVSTYTQYIYKWCYIWEMRNFNWTGACLKLEMLFSFISTNFVSNTRLNWLRVEEAWNIFWWNNIEYTTLHTFDRQGLHTI